MKIMTFVDPMNTKNSKKTFMDLQETAAEKCSNNDKYFVPWIQKCSQGLHLMLETLQTLYSVLKHQIERSMSESVLGGGDMLVLPLMPILAIFATGNDAYTSK